MRHRHQIQIEAVRGEQGEHEAEERKTIIMEECHGYARARIGAGRLRSK